MALLPFGFDRIWAGKRRPAPEVVPLTFPPPFRRMLAINSDVEFTRWPMQLDWFRFLADRKLETAFSYWFFGDPEVTWHLFNRDFSPTPEAPGAMILLEGGLLDTLHAFAGAMNGRGCDFDREMIRRGYAALEQKELGSRIFSNHGTIYDIQNVGGPWADLPGHPNYMKGDVPGTQRYHLDLTLRHGARFFWLDIDRIREHVTFAAQAGEERDKLFVSQTCRDGNRILRFRRTDAMVDPDGAKLGDALDRILAAPDGGYTVVYTHLGVKRDPEGRPLVADFADVPAAALGGLDRLAQEQAEGRILVTTTERLLTHALMSAARPWTIERRGKRIEVELKHEFTFEDIRFHFSWDDFMGFCIPVEPGEILHLTLNGTRRTADRYSVAGQSYAGLRWQTLPMTHLIERAASAA
jgi:hypothetical protein